MVKKKCPPFENHERWLVSYADMLTLLFAVFVVLFALKEGGDRAKLVEARGSVEESFDVPLEGIPESRLSGPQEDGFGIFNHFRGQTLRPPLAQRIQDPDHMMELVGDEMAQVKLKLDDTLYGAHTKRRHKPRESDRPVSVKRTAKGFKLQLKERYFYDADGVHLKREALKEVDGILESVKHMGRDITIEGHTDSLPAKGRYSNWQLSTLRAANFLQYMIAEHNFPSSQLRAVGYADTRSIAHNGSEEGRRLNRRIEIHLNYVNLETFDP